MHTNYDYHDLSAWDKGDLAYDLGDTMEVGIAKAAEVGIKPCTNGYAEFMTAFGRRMRVKQVSPHRPTNVVDLVQPAATSAPVGSSEQFLRAAS